MASYLMFKGRFITSYNLTKMPQREKQSGKVSLPEQLFTPEHEHRQTGKMKMRREEIHKKRGLTPAGRALCNSRTV